jgi:hypothetical protein
MSFMNCHLCFISKNNIKLQKIYLNKTLNSSPCLSMLCSSHVSSIQFYNPTIVCVILQTTCRLVKTICIYIIPVFILLCIYWAQRYLPYWTPDKSGYWTDWFTKWLSISHIISIIYILLTCSIFGWHVTSIFHDVLETTSLAFLYQWNIHKLNICHFVDTVLSNLRSKA